MPKVVVSVRLDPDLLSLVKGKGATSFIEELLSAYLERRMVMIRDGSFEITDAGNSPEHPAFVCLKRSF